MTRTLNLVAFVIFASSLFMRSTDPVIPLIASGLSVDPASAALLSTAFTLPYALIQPVLGAIADTFSKTRLMLLCLFIMTIASIASALAPTFEWLIAARVIAGLAAGGVVPISFAIVGDLVPVAQRQVAMGRLLFALMTGNLLGATLAGVVGDLAGWRAVFFASGAVGTVRSGGCRSGVARRRRSAEEIRSVDARAELPHHFQQSLGQNLFRRGVSRSRVHVGRVSLHRDTAASGRRDARIDRRHCHCRVRHWRRVLWSVRVAPAAASW